MSINSRNKGARGEREAAQAWAKLFPGLGCIRGQQRSGIEQADVVGVSDTIHLEVKRYKTFSIWKYVKQMRRDAKENQVPVLMFRPDGDTDWHIAFSLSHLQTFCEAIKGITDDCAKPSDTLQRPEPADG